MVLRLCECAREPALPRRQLGLECWLRRQPVTVRAEHAARRLALVPEPLRRKRVPDDEWPPGRRWCQGCQTFVSLQDVARGRARCRTCEGAARHLGSVASTYGIEASDYDRLMGIQLGRCAICRCQPRTRRLVVDHDHGSGRVRGLICTICNEKLLGGAHDSLERLRSAVSYMEYPPWAALQGVPDTRDGPSRVVWDTPF